AALGTLNGPAFELVDYAEHSSAAGASARAVAYVAIRVGETVRYGAGRDDDVVIAALRAVVSAYNRAQSDSGDSRAA
ncbi:MAG TPA: alpha-isopropylmalate synthase regulatory domain-containing protein, partial [Polyangiaceae bacterium]|nr:alpha-isopropylmalate synthase regulatory domain-containing protein [Polyangiaceae bacterium]